MTFKLPYETKAGVFSEGETFMQAIEHLRLAQEAVSVLGHYKKENGDELIGQCYLAFAMQLGLMCHHVTQAATKGIRQ